MNIKKKIQPNSYKKLLSNNKKTDLKINQQLFTKQHTNIQNSSYNQGVKSSSKNKSAQKILSVYESSRAKFKIGKFITNNNQRQHRIKTQNDQFNKTKSHYHKINSVRKLNSSQKQQPKDKQIKDKYSSGIKNPSNKINNNINGNNNIHNNNNNGTKQIYDQKGRPYIDMNKQRTFNKRLHLNSQLFENITKHSLQKSQIPQTSKHQKKNNISFRKQHDSYRGINKKTALQKYISQSLQNLDCPIKKKNSKNITIHNKINQSNNSNDNDITMLKQSSGSKQKNYKIIRNINNNQINNKNNNNFIQNNNKQKLTILQDQQSSSIQKLDYSSNNHPYQKCIFDNNTDQVKQARTIRSPQQRNYPEKSHRRLKTQTNDSIQKIQIKWERKKKNPFDLSNQQMDTFGDRFPDGYDKIKLLGRGGFSLVWLGQHKKSKKKYAIKQIITQSNHQTHKKQIWFGEYFFEFGGLPKGKFVHCPGIKNLVKLYYYFVNKKDTWLLYQKCGDSLGNALYELKGQNYNGQKMYRIHYKQFYSHVRSNQNEIRKIIFEVSRALQLLADSNIVHSDLKTQNILVKVRSGQDQGKTVDAKGSGRRFNNSILQQVKLIDYGSSFQFNNLRQFSMATPQYMAPQILNFILYQNELEYIPKLFQYVQQYNQPWVIDIWSLGCVILQIISGIPLWMSLKTIVKRKGLQLIKYGLFAVKGRIFDKIIKKQLQVVQNLQKFIIQQNYSDIVIQEDIKYLLKRMLSLNPSKRISPTQIIDFLTKKSLQKN